MQDSSIHTMRTAGLAALLLHCAAHAEVAAQQATMAAGAKANSRAAVASHQAPVQERLEALQRQVDQQRAVIDALARELAEQRRVLAAHPGSPPSSGRAAHAPQGGQRASAAAYPAGGPGLLPAHALSATAAELEHHRGGGRRGAAAAAHAGAGAAAESAQSGAAESAAVGTTEMSAVAAAGSAARNAAEKAGNAAAPETAGPAARPAPRHAAHKGAVGRPPAGNDRPPEVAPLFEQPGILTPKGKFVFEPSLQFGYSSSNRLALVGYTVIPALLIGLVDVREVKRNTTTATIGGRLGLTSRLEIDAKIPYVYRSDSTVSREIFTGAAVENVFSTSGKGMGDAEIGLRYQLNRGGPDKPFYVGSLRYKSRTGRDPFSVVTDCTRRCIGPNATGTGLPLDLPTGSGFHSLQPGLTWLFPSDPAVFFGSISYLHNFKRSKVSRKVLGGEREWLGDIDPGDIVGFNFGMGLGLNDKASLSLGYDHHAIGRTYQAGRPVPGSVRTQLGTLLLGYSYRLSERRSLNVSVGAGLTRDTPDVSLTVRLPTTF